MKLFPRTFTIIFTLSLLIPIFGFAQTPGIPHQFYGTVSFSNGTATDGLLVEAKIGNTTIGTSITDDGKYGYGDLLLVADSQGTNAGKTVEFYVSNIKANQTAIFVNGESTNLNLTVFGTIGTIEETDENKTIENQTTVVTPTQPTSIKLGDNLNITVSSATNTNATINKIEKLSGDFFTGATAIIAGNNLLNAFEIDITGDDLTISVSMTYDDADIDEDTIKPYRHDGTSWVEISDFDINKTTNIITFTISSAETPYAIFGSESEPEPEPEQEPAPSADTGTTGGGGATTPTTYKTGDIDKNNKIDVFDFNTLMVNWGNNPANSAADLDGNGKVDIFDFNLLMVNWG